MGWIAGIVVVHLTVHLVLRRSIHQAPAANTCGKRAGAACMRNSRWSMEGRTLVSGIRPTLWRGMPRHSRHERLGIAARTSARTKTKPRAVDRHHVVGYPPPGMRINFEDTPTSIPCTKVHGNRLVVNGMEGIPGGSWYGSIQYRERRIGPAGHTPKLRGFGDLQAGCTRLTRFPQVSSKIAMEMMPIDWGLLRNFTPRALNRSYSPWRSFVVNAVAGTPALNKAL